MYKKRCSVTAKIGCDDFVPALPPVLPIHYAVPPSIPSLHCCCCRSKNSYLAHHHSASCCLFPHNPVIGGPPPLSGHSPVISEAITSALLPTPDIVPPPSSLIYGNACAAGYGVHMNRVRELMLPLPPVPRSAHVLPPNGPFTSFVDGKDVTNHPQAYTSPAAVPPICCTCPYLRWPKGSRIA